MNIYGKIKKDEIKVTNGTAMLVAEPNLNY